MSSRVIVRYLIFVLFPVVLVGVGDNAAYGQKAWQPIKVGLTPKAYREYCAFSDSWELLGDDVNNFDAEFKWIENFEFKWLPIEEHRRKTLLKYFRDIWSESLVIPDIEWSILSFDGKRTIPESGCSTVELRSQQTWFEVPFEIFDAETKAKIREISNLRAKDELKSVNVPFADRGPVILVTKDGKHRVWGYVSKFIKEGREYRSNRIVQDSLSTGEDSVVLNTGETETKEISLSILDEASIERLDAIRVMRNEILTKEREDRISRGVASKEAQESLSNPGPIRTTVEAINQRPVGFFGLFVEVPCRVRSLVYNGGDFYQVEISGESGQRMMCLIHPENYFQHKDSFSKWRTGDARNIRGAVSLVDLDGSLGLLLLSP